MPSAYQAHSLSIAPATAGPPGVPVSPGRAWRCEVVLRCRQHKLEGPAIGAALIRLQASLWRLLAGYDGWPYRRHWQRWRRRVISLRAAGAAAGQPAREGGGRSRAFFCLLSAASFHLSSCSCSASLARYHPCNRLRISLASQSKSQFTALNHSPWPFLFVQATAGQMAGSISTGAGCGSGSYSGWRREEEREPRDFQYSWDFQVTNMAALIDYTLARLLPLPAHCNAAWS